MPLQVCVCTHEAFNVERKERGSQEISWGYHEISAKFQRASRAFQGVSGAFQEIPVSIRISRGYERRFRGLRVVLGDVQMQEQRWQLIPKICTV